MTSAYDIIVVGGGSVGVPCAYYLANQGCKVLLIEKRPAVGQGENKAAIGGVRATHSDPAKILLCMRSLDVLRTWQQEHGDDVGWKPGGYCFPAYDESTERVLRSLLPRQHEYGLVNDYVDASTIAQLVPGITTRGLRGGTYSPDDGQASSLLLPSVLMRHAMKHGAEFRVQEQVTGYDVQAGRIVGVVTNKQRYACAGVVLATGSDAAHHGELLGYPIAVVPDSHEAGISAPVQPFLKPLVVDLRPGPEGKTVNFYFGQNKEGQIIFCYTPKRPFIGTDHRSQSEFLPILASRMIELVPRFRHLLVRRVWRGCYPSTPDGVPILGPVKEIEGLTLAVGMCGQGFMLGIGVGQEVASIVMNGRYLLPQRVAHLLRVDRDFHGQEKEALE